MKDRERSDQPNNRNGRTVLSQQPNSTTSNQKPNNRAVLSEQPNNSVTVLSQQPNSKSVISQQPNSKSVISQQPNSKSLTSQQPNSKSLISQQPNSKSLTSQQPNSKSVISQQPNSRAVYSRDEEKQRFIDRLICSPDITSPRDEADTPRSRRVHTPELPLPINQRQVDIEKLQDLFSESPSYVPNLNNVNQFNESYVLASPQPHQTTTPGPVDTEEVNRDLFDQYVKTFESDASDAGTTRVNAQPMSITTNNFAHDQSCKKIIKIGEYSPLNPHFQPQPSVLHFGNDQFSHISTADQTRSCLDKQRDLDSQMPSKKSKAVQICADSSSSCVEDEDIEVVGTGLTSLPSIETKDSYRRYLASRTPVLLRGNFYDIHPEARYPHMRSQHHVETCGGGDPIATVKLKQELYKTELDKQIQEKRKVAEERRRREAEEDEKAQRAFLEQQERLRREFLMEEENKLQNAMQRQKREELLKEKIHQLQIQQDEEKARKRKEKEASLRRQRREVENHHPWVSGNPTSIMLPNPFGPPNPRLNPIQSHARPVDTGDQYLAPPPARSRYQSRDGSPSYMRDASPRRPLGEENQYRSRDVSPIRPPIEKFRDISPVRPLRETLPDSPSLGKGEGALITNAPQELSMPLRRGKHHRVTFIEETGSPSPPPPRTRSTSPVLPAVRTHHRMKDLATAVPCSASGETVLKNATNRNVLTQLGQFRRQLYLENLRMNERLRQNEWADQHN
ncbi:hypothetical protein M8J75_015986 [Diaphorina citri]|nr:hypothetical protein M8J75_015986 [Diaphorina citri]